MTRECHVRFREGLGVKVPGATLPTGARVSAFCLSIYKHWPQKIRRKIGAIALLEQSKVLKIFRESARKGRFTSEAYAI